MNDLKATWIVINQLLGKTKKKTKNIISIDNEVNVDDEVIPNHFNNEFSNVAANLTKDVPNSPTNFLNYYLGRAKPHINVPKTQ